MKTFSLGLVAALVVTLGAATFAQHTSAAGSLSCGPLRDTCATGTQPVCTDNHWQCVPKNARSSPIMDNCGINNIRCMNGYAPVCANETWTCRYTGISSSSSSIDACIAECSDGFRYRTCTEDGSPINYFADPCMNHSNSSMSTSSAPSCGPNNVRCMEGFTPMCANNAWTCMSNSRSSRSSSSRSSVSNVHITSMTPAMVSVRGKVTIEGSGFARRGNAVLFDNSVIPNLRSLDGKHLTFRIPTRTMRACYFQFSKLMLKCTKPTRIYGAGDYDVSVRVKGDVSNMMTLTLQ